MSVITMTRPAAGSMLKEGKDRIMTNRDRFKAVMDFKPVDRLPMIEWAPWWDKTVTRWRGEGLPADVTGDTAIRNYFGLDIYEQCWMNPAYQNLPEPEGHGKPVIRSAAEYDEWKDKLFPEEPFDRAKVERWAAQQVAGETVVWITLNGYFWHPRVLFGIAEHMYAFFDHADLMHRMNKDLTEYNLRILDRFCEICTPDFMTFAEDMSYNNGPMIGKDLFDEFMAPYYNRIVPELKKRGILPVVDSDGNIEDIIPWFGEVGINGFLPLEKQAGFDIVKVRQKHPETRFIGGYDKMVMSKGEQEMRAEFERLLPVMKQGGYIPSCDHQTPPGVSMDNYRIYLRLLDEYCIKASR